MPERVSPSLVEAAARALYEHEAKLAGSPSDRWERLSLQSKRYYTGKTRAMLAAVGDALRLEGAQAERERGQREDAAILAYGEGVRAERERIVAVIAPRLERARGMGTGDLYLDLLLSALGVHPEASDG